MAIRVYTVNTKLSAYFYSDEFKCSVCSEVGIASELIDRVEELFSF